MSWVLLSCGWLPIQGFMQDWFLRQLGTQKAARGERDCAFLDRWCFPVSDTEQALRGLARKTCTVGPQDGVGLQRVLQELEVGTSTRKLSRQLWPNTKSGRWRCLCLPNAGPWSCRPPWMPTPLQVGIQHHDGSSWLNAAVTTWAQAVLPLQPQAAGTTGKKLSKLKNQLLFLNLQET
ncbi:uncharacterized protein isoform X4 [Macaca fascicularis]|uniref:uncharacterized protein isoform X4 n=1 Tax=Macaca fascicularis TaxID=9541 RepID=UPI0032B06145